MSIVICGHVDAGKSTTTGRLIFELGGISEREMVSFQSHPHGLALALASPRRIGRSADSICRLLIALFSTTSDQAEG